MDTYWATADSALAYTVCFSLNICASVPLKGLFELLKVHGPLNLKKIINSFPYEKLGHLPIASVLT